MAAVRSTESDPRAGRRRFKPVRRDVLVKCATCKCSGTARVNAKGNLTSINLAAELTEGVWRHRGCYGAFTFVDTSCDAQLPPRGKGGSAGDGSIRGAASGGRHGPF